ncbi:hypothetical protein [Seonamhaeicola aphaedonensis]|uniref:Uncharacterized protein n=1 Tax=Seonamhaeicola aphaedonensis TaxID=1461338 RepID=A0A3D9H3U5_9FLAO|nr:hypothetical protein [Seonamhaeicola aphaedonensis]RED44150.1 hypothetical protein DFQ02_1232 [Seonamhaeicola aphaedonensis]
MHKSLTILNTDRINKYGHLIALSAMEDMVWMKATEGVPMHVGHDMHRPIGAMIPFGLYFEPKLVRSLGLSLIPENDEETKQILNFKNYSTIKNIKDEVEKNDEKLYNEVKEHIISDFKYIETGTLSIFNTDIVKRLFKELESFQDKDGLIKLKDLNKNFTYKFQGVFLHNSLPLCIYAHNFFRRSLSRHNNFHFIFLDELMSFQNNDDITIKLALDWDLIGYSPTFLQSMEYEYWFGPKYNDDISKIQRGLTKHSCSEFEREYYGISTTEFFWKDNENLKEFELEELRENDAPTMDDFFGCRYMHSIYDTTKSTFVHFDGAIRGYNSDLYFERIDQNMTDFGRRSEYKKLFRIDGKLELSNWKSLITNYMQDNPLIYEYFDIKKPESELNKKQEPKTLIQQLVPHSMNRDDGIKLLVSYHKKNEEFKDFSHSISIYDIVNINGVDKDVIEDEVIEIKKALNRLGKDLHIEADTLFGNFKDEYWNIPCIFHSATNPIQDIKITLEALRTIFKRMVEKGFDTIISFTIAWNLEEKEVRVSSLGHVENLFNWISYFQSIPIDRDHFKIWLDEQRTYLNSTFEGSIDKPLIQDICQFDGILYLKRKFVEPEFNLEPFSDENTLSCRFSIPDNDEEKYKEIVNGNIRPVMSYIVKKAKCGISNQDYHQSPYSKILDDDAYMIVEKIDGLTFYWSDKPIV